MYMDRANPAGSDQIPNTVRLLDMRGIYSNQVNNSSSALEAHYGLGKIGRVNLPVLLPGGRKVNVANNAADRYFDLNLKQGAVKEA